ncbi:hypothetical protein AB0K80_22505 [Streptomyces sp. NPDC052682]|uniref:hypothetical protein n=1 Tax=Streptomyces sp. NPDC052682 TaxID=3154954 RepID=UPI003429BD7B
MPPPGRGRYRVPGRGVWPPAGTTGCSTGTASQYGLVALSQRNFRTQRTSTHEAVVSGAVPPDPVEVAWYGWLSEDELRGALSRWPFVADSRETHRRYTALAGDGGGGG